VRLPLSIPIDRRHCLARLFCRGDIEALVLGADGGLSVERHSGVREEVSLDAATAVFTGLVILRMRHGRQRETLALPSCATGAEAQRRLRIWLRWRARPGLISGAA
jgi:hypothetical protein